MGLFEWGDSESEFDKSKAEEKAREEALLKIMNQTPDELQLEQYTPDKYQEAGSIDPRLISPESIQYDPLAESEMADISVDPRLRSAQMDALLSLQDIGHGGLTAQDKADLSRIQSEANQQDKGRRDAILMNNQARGMGGSGQELLAQLASSQAATDRQAQQGLDIEGMAQQRALAALSQSGQLGGQIRGQEFDEQAKKASAADAVAKFNAANTWQGQQFNAGQNFQGQQFNANAANDASRFNLSQKQDVLNQNVRAGNEAQRINKFDAPIAKQNSQNDIYGQRVAGAKTAAELAAQRTGREAAGGQASTSAILGGAGAGAATGATVGGPWGAVIGGVLGAGGAYMATKKK